MLLDKYSVTDKFRFIFIDMISVCGAKEIIINNQNVTFS
jgi:hypothetical protein